jgi:hypothetical protein
MIDGTAIAGIYRLSFTYGTGQVIQRIQGTPKNQKKIQHLEK